MFGYLSTLDSPFLRYPLPQQIPISPSIKSTRMLFVATSLKVYVMNIQSEERRLLPIAWNDTMSSEGENEMGFPPTLSSRLVYFHFILCQRSTRKSYRSRIDDPANLTRLSRRVEIRQLQLPQMTIQFLICRFFLDTIDAWQSGVYQNSDARTLTTSDCHTLADRWGHFLKKLYLFCSPHGLIDSSSRAINLLCVKVAPAKMCLSSGLLLFLAFFSTAFTCSAFAETRAKEFDEEI